MKKLIGIFSLVLSTSLFAAEPPKNSQQAVKSTPTVKNTQVVQPPTSNFTIPVPNQNLLNDMQKCNRPGAYNPETFQKCMAGSVAKANPTVPRNNQTQVKDNPILVKIEKCKTQARGSQDLFKKCMYAQFPNTIPPEQRKMQLTGEPGEQVAKPTNQPMATNKPQGQQPQPQSQQQRIQVFK